MVIGHKDGKGKFHPHRQNIVDVNRRTLERWYSKHPTEPKKFLIRNEIDDVIKHVRNVRTTGNRKEDVVRKASHLMSSIAWHQPFGDANKRTAYVSAKNYLNDNGYTLKVKNKKDVLELNKLLVEVQGERSRMNPLIVKKIIFYTRNHIEKL